MHQKDKEIKYVCVLVDLLYRVCDIYLYFYNVLGSFVLSAKLV